MERKLLTVIGVLMVTAVGAGVMTSVGQALEKGQYAHWNSVSNPLRIDGYGSTGLAYGQWRIADSSIGTRSFLDSSQKIYNASDHQVYTAMETWTNAGYCVQPTYTTCNQDYYPFASSATKHYSGSTYAWYYANTALNANAGYARARASVRLDIPWRTDPASGWAITSNSSY